MTHGLLPTRRDAEPDADPGVLALDDADEVIEVLTSRTARSVLCRLHEEPATASELAATAESSLQNVHYHLDRLRAAALIEVHDTWYSEKGRKMKVYAPAHDPLVLYAGDSADDADLRASLADAVGEERNEPEVVTAHD